MKILLILWFICIFELPWAYAGEEPPAPASITLPALDAARLNTLTLDLVNRVRAAEARERAELGLQQQELALEMKAEEALGELQQKLDKIVADRDAARASAKRQAHAKWFWFAGALLEALFIFRKPIARCFGVPLP